MDGEPQTLCTTLAGLFASGAYPGPLESDPGTRLKAWCCLF